MKKIKLLIMALKIEYNWILIKKIRRKREKLTSDLEKNANKERALKYDASVEARNYENLSGLRDAA